jgi:hypothetical protein
MNRYTIARVANIKGNEIAGSKYVLYTLNQIPVSRSSHTMSPELPKLIATYLSIVREESSAVLSTRPTEQFLSLSIGNRKTATFRLEELVDSEKEEVKTAIFQAEQ